jgi:amino acid transporter
MFHGYGRMHRSSLIVAFPGPVSKDLLRHFLRFGTGFLFWGGLPLWDGGVFSRNWTNASSGLPFWFLFAIFFPAVTVFTQRVSMSGDLKDPGKSLPLGTFMAVGVSILVYFGVAVVFAGACPRTSWRRITAPWVRLPVFPF